MCKLLFIANLLTVAVLCSREGIVFPDDDTALTCITRNGTNGICKAITECSLVMDTVSKETPTICHFEREEPVICCPNNIQSQTLKSKNVTETQDKPNSIFLAAEPSTEAPVVFDLLVESCGSRQFFQTTKRDSVIFVRRKRYDFMKVVVGGEESYPNSWPWMVAIIRTNPAGSPRFLCGGSILNARFILTAAHCLEDKSLWSRLKVLTGIHDRSLDSAGIYEVEKVIMHEDYVSRRGYHDIALLKLSKDIEVNKKVGAVCLPEASTEGLAGKVATVTGWGDTFFGGNSSKVLREVQIPIVANEACNGSYYRTDAIRFNKGIIDGQVCAGLSQGGKDACQGDSGGPLVLQTESDRWRIAGVVSYGIGCAQPGFPGVYTRVAHYLDWIKKNSGLSPPKSKVQTVNKPRGQTFSNPTFNVGPAVLYV